MEVLVDAAFEPLLELEMEMATLVADWSHCDQSATYVARMVSHDRHDPIRHANLLSAALNELFEMSFHTRESDGALTCRFYRNGSTERIELTFPCSAEQRNSYETIVERIGNGQALANYLDVITDDAARAEHAILLGLAVNYDANIELSGQDTGMMTFVVDLALERLLN
ncbi:MULTISPECIES: ubiquinone biosynthesis methyltransferase UbiE [unclassified Rhizobium]|uniref:ubiquinone biosynthesis methyltransferase UbiE n=1 Tax=unclassified Rhizobium TaxID=2613769 RepID=UPI000EA9E43B|nr:MULTISPECIES: ubiquinone biosynthesis methyltransferase UbiE [unclassified Rhizobium]AYG69698.1 ubiquinone biosynthesis methyltransferase UbiE [Rhizobium sp. CCGE531]AYG76073.1 ubiquinone biosynthesis methyltransferase UbiE [Rhizobium sp. CCGE532]